MAASRQWHCNVQRDTGCYAFKLISSQNTFDRAMIAEYFSIREATRTCNN